MVLIYSASITPRLQYICSFIFKELVQVAVEITDNRAAFVNHEGVRINYSELGIAANEIRIPPVGLLFETGTHLQTVECFETNGYKAFFKTAAADFPFDVFAASFYLLSRYEEYGPHTKDLYGRYAHENSLAFKEGFLQLPLVNIWVKSLVRKLLEFFPAFHCPLPAFHFLPSYDIDIAYSYKHKGINRTIGGFLRSPSAERLNVLAGSAQDPFDVYDWMDALHRQHSLKPVYFFLVAEKNGPYDRNILPGTNAMKELIASHAAQYAIGIHPSWQSGGGEKLLKDEIDMLQTLGGKSIHASRQHYIRFNLPGGYRHLIATGITDDYSMGYGSINGFRASVASSFYWYDLEQEVQTGLRIHPFCFMDANSLYEQKLSAQEAYEELMQYYRVCKEVNGTLITIWHNNYLGSDPQFTGWKECYEAFIAQVQQ